MAKPNEEARVLAHNRRARHHYHVLETLEAGIALAGTEVKSAREGKVTLKDSFVELRDGEAWLVRAHIGPYSHGNRQNHEPERARKLLLRRREIERLTGKMQGRGLTVVPLRVLARGSWIKVEIALVQGKKLYDKRESERARELDREMEQARKYERVRAGDRAE
ncbi:MAG TPA: SsrA-binding protein SmpB [Thermoanaerobaculia bacterium]|nr:SsrA-binding protein SmpB [Thermoanaerobaculia bacterium]